MQNCTSRQPYDGKTITTTGEHSDLELVGQFLNYQEQLIIRYQCPYCRIIFSLITIQPIFDRSTLYLPYLYKNWNHDKLPVSQFYNG